MEILQAKTGITVLFRRVKSRLVSVRYVVKCGSIDEHRPEEFGLCHALEHMFYAGTKTRTWDQITTGFRSLGAYSNASTGHNKTDYEFLVPRENWAAAFEIAADMMYNPTFPEERWEKVEKSAIVNELLANESSPEWMLEDKILTSALGGKENYHHPAGFIDSVKAANVSDLLSFRDRFYMGGNVYLSISGDLTPSQVLRVVDKYDKWDYRSPEPRLIPPLAFDYTHGIEENSGFDQAYLQFIKPVRKLKSDKELVLAQVLGEILNAHLHSEVREKRGLCYSICSDLFRELPQNDFLGIDTSVADVESQEKAVEAIEEVLQDFPEHGMSDLAIRCAQMECYRSLLSVENIPEYITGWCSDYWANGGVSDPPTFAHDHLQDLDVDKLRSLATEFLGGEYKIWTLEPAEYEDCEECDED